MTATQEPQQVADDPAADPIGTVREIQNHIYVKLANPADEPWHIVWCHGEQFMSGWQSNECMVGSTKWDGYLPVRECGTEGKDFVDWERWLETKRGLDEAQRQARVWKNLHTAAAQSRDELAAELRQAVEDWGRNDEAVLDDSQRLADENEWLTEACRLTVREAASVRADRDRLHKDAATARKTLMDLVSGNWTVEPSLSDLAHYAAQFSGQWKQAAEAEAELLKQEQAERRRAHTALRAQLAEATSLADDLLAMFATGEKGHPGRPCVRTGWIDEDAIARLRERRAALEATPTVHEGNPDV